MDDVTPVAAVCNVASVCCVVSDFTVDKNLLLIIRFGWINCMALLFYLFGLFSGISGRTGWAASV